MKASTLLIVAALLLGGYCWAQEKSSQPASQAKPPVSKFAEVKEDWQNEQESQQRRIEELRREHSDESGRPRPDLFEKGVAQLQRMKVTNQIGPGPKTTSVDKP